MVAVESAQNVKRFLDQLEIFEQGEQKARFF